jgi:outer membrane protein insertion porin family
MIKYILTFIFFLHSYAYSEVVKEIQIAGNDRVSSETIKIYGEVLEGKDYTPADISDVIKKLYSTEFFEDVNIEVKNKILKINVKEYPIINLVQFEGEKTKKVKEAILERLKLQPKSSFIKSYLNDDMETVKKMYASLGFNFVTVESKIENFSENRLNLIYLVNKGKKTSISKINFIGDKKIKDKTLRDIIASEEDKFWKFLSKNTDLNFNNTELDKRLLVNYYKSIGYYDVQVLSSNAEITSNNDTILTYNINAGTRYKVSKISTNVSDVFDKKIFFSLEKEFKKVVGKYYSPFKVTKLLDEIDALILENDLQFVEHSVSESISGETIEVKINIFEGNKQLVERINIKGNTITDESVVRAELMLDEGDPFSNIKVEKSIAKLKSRNLFGEVLEVVSEGSSKDLKIIDISVEEKPTGEISAGAGVGTEGGSFSFNVSENNWLGKGKKVSTFVNLNKTTFQGGFTVTDPNYDFSGNSLSYGLTTTTNDKPESGFKNKIYSSSVGVGFEQYRNIYISPGLTLSFDDLKVESTASESLKKQAGEFTDLAGSYSISLDKRDRTFKPTNGYLSSFTQQLPIYSDAPNVKNSYSYSLYNQFNPDLIGSFKFYAANIMGIQDEDVRLSKRINIPSSRLRGFEYGKVGPKDGRDYVGGNNALAVNFEGALPNLLPESTKTDVSVFLDFANVWGVDYDSTVGESSTLRSSIGVNTGWNSPLGPMTFTFTNNLSKADSDIAESFNFRLGTTF